MPKKQLHGGTRDIGVISPSSSCSLGVVSFANGPLNLLSRQPTDRQHIVTAAMGWGRAMGRVIAEEEEEERVEMLVWKEERGCGGGRPMFM